VIDAGTKAGRDLGFITLEKDAFAAATAISIDCAVMEKTSQAAVVPVDCGWSDVGSWHAEWTCKAMRRAAARCSRTAATANRAQRGRPRGHCSVQCSRQ
jgi:mannose-1-phosphate guanylyltransferase